MSRHAWRAQAMSNRPGKRARRQAAVSALLDDDADQVAGIVDVDFDGQGEFSNFALRKLQRQVNRDDPQPVVQPYHAWPEGARRANEAFVSHVATLVEKHIVAPRDPALREALRRTEALHAPERGYASISLYDARRADPTYAAQVLGIGDRAPRRIDGPLDHVHIKEFTRIAEMRVANGLNRHRPLERALVASENFVDACMPVDCAHALHSLDTYDQALRVGASLAAAAASRRVAPLASFVATLAADCAMPVFALRFLHDATVELCMHMEATSSYFALFTLSIREHVAALARAASQSSADALVALRATVCAEVATERAKSEKRLDTAAALLQVPVEALSATQLRERETIVRDEREFRALADKFHVDFTAQDAATAGAPGAEQEVQRNLQYATLVVFAIAKSATLMALPCTYSYVYFGVCQCLMDEPTATPPTTTPAANGTTLLQTATARVTPVSGEQTTMLDGVAMTSSVGFDFNKRITRR